MLLLSQSIPLTDVVKSRTVDEAIFMGAKARFSCFFKNRMPPDADLVAVLKAKTLSLASESEEELRIQTMIWLWMIQHIRLSRNSST